MTAQSNPVQSPAPKPFTIKRTFDAPRDVVFEAWTELEGIKNWMGPKGVSVIKATQDFRPGGKLHYLMRTQDGKEMWGKWTYREIVMPERVVAVVAFSDERPATKFCRTPWRPIGRWKTYPFVSSPKRTARPPST